jgi:hypothetical protein
MTLLVNGHQHSQGPRQVRNRFETSLTLLQGLFDRAEFEIFEIQCTALQQIRGGPAGGRHGGVLLIHSNDRPNFGQSLSFGHAIDAAAQNANAQRQDVVLPAQQSSGKDTLTPSLADRYMATNNSKLLRPERPSVSGSAWPRITSATFL